MGVVWFLGASRLRPLQPTSGTEVVPTSDSVRTELRVRRSRLSGMRDMLCAIVGVAPPGFIGHQGGYAPEVWLPLRPLTDRKLLESRSMAFFGGVMGRLAPGVGMTQAETELTALYQQILAADAETHRELRGSTTCGGSSAPPSRSCSPLWVWSC
jgi:hypothetical protein